MRTSNLGGGVINFLPERPKRYGEQSEKFPKIPIALSEKFPE